MTDHPKPIARYYYECQERAMAPGIADGWPEIIPAPHTKNGRLVRRDWKDREAALAAEREKYEARIAELESLVDDIFSDLDVRASMKGPDEPLGIGSGLVYRYDRDLKQRRKRALLEKKP